MYVVDLQLLPINIYISVDIYLQAQQDYYVKFVTSKITHI